MSSCRFADGQAHLVKGFNVSAFYEVLAAVVVDRRSTWRLLARETGVSGATLRRLAQGRCPNAATLTALSAWADLNPADFVVTAQNEMPGLAAISAVLESDPNLEPAAARDLETIIYLAYAGFRQQY